eukprot:COSAG02_NODE_120_length_35326_cov_39.000823_2_plen_149_part_00
MTSWPDSLPNCAHMHWDVDLRSRRMWAASYRLTRLVMNENSELLESFCTGHARVRAERGGDGGDGAVADAPVLGRHCCYPIFNFSLSHLLLFPPSLPPLFTPSTLPPVSSPLWSFPLYSPPSLRFSSPPPLALASQILFPIKRRIHPR